MKIFWKAAAALLCALLLWEILLEAFVVRSAGFEYHSTLGRIVKGGLLVQGDEGYAMTHINSLGMRNGEIAVKRPREYRILSLGDSFTEAEQVADTKTYSYLLQEALKAKVGGDIDVINAGRDGGSPAYYIHLADYYNQTLKPDYVVVELNETDFTRDILNRGQYFYLDRDPAGFHTVKNPVKNSLAGGRTRLTRRLPFLRDLRRFSVVRVGFKNLTLMRSLSSEIGDEGADRPDAFTPDARAGLEWSIGALQRMYPHLALVYMPLIDYNHPDQVSEVEKCLEATTRQRGVDYFNMRNDFVGYYQTHHQMVHGFDNTEPGVGHINRLGHALVADCLTAYFESKLKK